MPSTFDIGDKPKLTFSPTLDGVATDATVVLTVTAPDGDVTTPTPAHPDTGVYEAEFEVDQAGNWVWSWAATGDVTTVEDGWLIVEPPMTADLYASVAELRTRFAINDTDDDELLEKAIRAASRGIDDATDRRFYTDTAATARIYRPGSLCRLSVDDFSTTVGLVVKTDDADSGTFGTTWAAADFQLEPLNGVVDGHSGWPFSVIRAVGSRTFPCYSRRATVQVTAKWGWAAVPAPIRDACLIAAAELYRMKDAPFGIQTGDFGAIRISTNPRVAALIAPYMRYPVKVA